MSAYGGISNSVKGPTGYKDDTRTFSYGSVGAPTFFPTHGCVTHVRGKKSLLKEWGTCAVWQDTGLWGGGLWGAG